jgi:acetyl-CoA acetyltransferase
LAGVMLDSFRDGTAIVGIGWTHFTKRSNRAVIDLAAEASLRALDDAGLRPTEVDGLVTSFWGAGGQDTVDPRTLAESLGIEDCRYRLFGAGGGSALCTMVGSAAMAVATGLCANVLVYRAANGSSARAPAIEWPRAEDKWRAHYGQAHAAAIFGPRVMAHMARYGTTSLDLAEIAVRQRQHASLNLKAMMRTPITVEDHKASPWVVEPFRLLDCCLQTDGAVAFVVTSRDRAQHLRHGPVYITAFVGGSQPFEAQPLWETNAPTAARLLYEAAGITAADVDLAELYDPFTGMCLLHIEGFGLAPVGEAADWVRAGGSGLDGETPVNTHGGLLSEAYIAGYNHVIEAVQQLRPGGVVDDLCNGKHDYDRTRCRQVRDPATALVCGESGESALLLRRA